MIYPDNKKQKTKQFPFGPGNEKINPDKFTTYMNKNKSNTNTQTKNVICDWSDKKNYLIQFRMLKIYVRHGRVDEKIHEILSFKQNKMVGKI